jgi:nicotinamide-nucleotide amidase
MSDERLRTLAQALGRAALARGVRIATAESCTGGLVSGAVTAIAGSSDWFEGGFVT